MRDTPPNKARQPLDKSSRPKGDKHVTTVEQARELAEKGDPAKGVTVKGKGSK